MNINITVEKLLKFGKELSLEYDNTESYEEFAERILIAIDNMDDNQWDRLPSDLKRWYANWCEGGAERKEQKVKSVKSLKALLEGKLKNAGDEVCLDDLVEECEELGFIKKDVFATITSIKSYICDFKSSKYGYGWEIDFHKKTKTWKRRG